MDWLDRCIKLLEQTVGSITAQSPVYETAAWGLEDQPDFLNLALRLETPLSPGELLVAIQQAEHDLGRQRVLKWGQRTLDIDILFYNDAIIQQPGLHIPHPHLQQRRFVLAPLHCIAPALVHPVFNKTIAELLLTCPDPLEVREYQQL